MRALVLLAILCATASARAYPQFQLTTDATRCNACHYSPAGGGLINGYGREEAADTISAGGDGGFLHGLWEPPNWLALGGDLRTAALISNTGATEGAELAAFPMQVDFYFRFQVSAFSAYFNLGLRGAARPEDPPLYSWLVSREHYLMWRPNPSGVYVRAGRFFAPYGLRIAEHIAYIRRFLGTNTFEEPYAVSGGFVEDDWELHATAFTPDFIRPVGHKGSGGAVYYERRFGSRAAAGAQARFAIGPEDSRVMAGLVGKYAFESPRLQLLAELDLVRQIFADVDGGDRWQVVGHLGVAWLFHRGFMAQTMLERYDEDLATKGVARDAWSAELQWFPTAHVEASLYGRVQLIGTGAGDGAPSQLLMLQLHYYL